MSEGSRLKREFIADLLEYLSVQQLDEVGLHQHQIHLIHC